MTWLFLRLCMPKSLAVARYAYVFWHTSSKKYPTQSASLIFLQFLTKGSLVIADRAYGTIKSIEHCLAAGGDFIIRIKNNPFHIYDENGRKLVLSDWLRTIGNTAAQLKVYIKNSEKKLVAVKMYITTKTGYTITVKEIRQHKNNTIRQQTFTYLIHVRKEIFAIDTRFFTASTKYLLSKYIFLFLLKNIF